MSQSRLLIETMLRQIENPRLSRHNLGFNLLRNLETQYNGTTEAVHDFDALSALLK